MRRLGCVVVVVLTVVVVVLVVVVLGGKVVGGGHFKSKSSRKEIQMVDAYSVVCSFFAFGRHFYLSRS